MKKTSFLLSFGLLLVILISCEKHKVSDIPIMGKWKWVMTEMIGGYARSTSDSVDSTYFIEFKSDGYRYLYNNSNLLVDQKKFELVNENIIKLGSEIVDEFQYSLENDTLAFTNMAGYIVWTNYYTRIK